MRMDKSIAIITARGGSKRIPGKNIKMFCGKPIIEYSIREAINSEQFDEDLYSGNNLHDKNLHFVQSISCHKRHDLIIYKVYCCFACQMTKQHN